MGSGKEQAIKITAKSGLTEDEIKRMVTDAELHADDDKKKRESISNKNNLDNMVYQSEKLVKDNKDKLGEAEIKPVEEAIAKAKEVLANATASADEFKTALDTLTQASHGISSKLYEQSKAQPGADAGASAGAGGAAGAEGKKDGEDVIDADYKDVKE
jgi:molecular chaperone DnaK